jgi:hypothetical protein
LSASLEKRSRFYLDANCAQCHQPGGLGITFDARYDTSPLNQNITNYPAQLVNSLLYSAPLLLTNNAVVSASAFEANLDNSIAVYSLFFFQPLYFTSTGFASNNMFQMGFSGVIGSNYVLQSSTNLVTWTSLATNVATTNLFYLTDPAASNYPYRFYRVLQQ